MTKEELQREMRVLVEIEGSLRPAKVIGPVEERTGKQVKIIGWKLHVGPSALDYQTTADKIHPTSKG